MQSFLSAIEAQIAAWHAIEAPNQAGRRLAAQLAETIAAHAKLRAAPELETPPTDFAATLLALRDEMIRSETET